MSFQKKSLIDKKKTSMVYHKYIHIRFFQRCNLSIFSNVYLNRKFNNQNIQIYRRSTNITSLMFIKHHVV